jgi:membrane-associated protease RseP (regulator of RpoE activity)
VAVPEHVWQLELRSAHIPPRDRGGHAWDDDGGPDPFIRLYRGETLVFSSSPITDDFDPEFALTLPKNVYLPPDEQIRIELWDSDVSDHIIGIWRGRGLPPNALPDADARIMLEGGATVTIRVHRPVAHRGVGITLYESRGSALHVLEVERFSPAGRAGIAVGDQIVQIGEETVSDLGDARAASALSLALDNGVPLVVETNGERRTVTIDRDFVWLTM